jgi:hypothetical protein
VMLLAALRDLYLNEGRGRVAKREAIDLIARRHWFALKDEDRQPYPSQNQAAGEPRWHTLIAWARKDAVLRDLVSEEARDAWGLTREGRNVFEEHQQLCRSGSEPVASCYLWALEFKRFMDPKYSPGPGDATRPRRFYRDIAPVPEKHLDTARKIIANGTLEGFAEKYRQVTSKNFGTWVPRGNSELDVERLARMVGEYLEAKRDLDAGLR